MLVPNWPKSKENISDHSCMDFQETDVKLKGITQREKDNPKDAKNRALPSGSHVASGRPAAEDLGQQVLRVRVPGPRGHAQPLGKERTGRKS